MGPIFDAKFLEFLAEAQKASRGGPSFCSNCGLVCEDDHEKTLAGGSERVVALCANCANARRSKRFEAYVQSCIPKAYRWAELDGADLLALLGQETVAKAKCATSLRNVCLVGPSGAGKSSLVGAMAKAWMRRRQAKARELRWVQWFSAFDLAYARVNSALGREAPEIAEAKAADLVVIDDLGQEPETHGTAVSSVIFARHDAAKTTWVTTGLTMAQLAARYGDGLLRRLGKDDSCFIQTGKQSKKK